MQALDAMTAELRRVDKKILDRMAYKRLKPG